MKHKLLTDVELRARWSQERSGSYCVEDGVILTPAAQDFIRENGITLCYTEQNMSKAMSMTPIPMREGKPVYQDAQTGRESTEKPEGMTHLRGNLLVPKTHPQIEFRGKLDTLMAKMMEVQILAQEQGETRVVADLEELLQFSRKLLAAEVKDELLAEVAVLGMDSAQIRYNSQQVKKVFGIEHPIPNCQMGKLCVAINSLRTQVREVELSAAKAFYDGSSYSRSDLIEGLNRLSSCVYIILCRKLSGYYERGNRL